MAIGMKGNQQFGKNNMIGSMKQTLQSLLTTAHGEPLADDINEMSGN